MKIYYKIVHKTMASYAHMCISMDVVNYKIGVKATPKMQSKLFVFEDKKIALEYANYDSNVKLFECTITGKSKALPFQPDDITYNSVRYFWKEYFRIKKKKVNMFEYMRLAFRSCDWPTSTVWCNSVTLTKDITPAIQ